MLVRAAVTLLRGAAVEVLVVAATPVTTTKATKVRRTVFNVWPQSEICCKLLKIHP